MSTLDDRREIARAQRRYALQPYGRRANVEGDVEHLQNQLYEAGQDVQRFRALGVPSQFAEKRLQMLYEHVQHLLFHRAIFRYSLREARYLP